MKKRLLSWALCAAMLLTMMPMAALADEADSTDTPSAAAEMPAYSGGSGTEADPWLISTVDDLKTLADTVNDGTAADFDADAAAGGSGVAGNYYGYYFRQTANLDLSDIANWEPIGYSGSGRYFAGNYDGDGYTISGAKSTGKNDADGFATAGIFGWVLFGLVKNLTVKDADFSANGYNNRAYAGGVMAVAYSCTVENCAVYNSSITSQRGPNNSNYAGGITGIALQSNFDKCASVENTIRHGSYGGGFIGSLDGGDSNFTNCYAAQCAVTGYSDTGSILTESGGFLGASQDGYAILKNCFVYDCTAQADKDSKADDIHGVFTGNTTAYDGVKADNCYYYEVNGLEAKTDNAVVKTAEEFEDGTVAKALGDAFLPAQGTGIPILNGPGDYSKVDEAIAKANELNKDHYQDFSGVESAVIAVVRGKKISEQSEIDVMAQAIEAAIAALEYKPADYTAVDAAIAKANALTKTDYTDFSAVDTAVTAVVRDKNITEQSDVDAMAKAIEDAIAALVKKPTSSGGSSSSSSSTPTYIVTVPFKTDNGSVSISSKNAKKGATVTITVKPDKGYVVESVSITDKNGNVIPVTKKSDTEYTFVMPASQVDIKATFMDDNTMLNHFVDVMADDYFYDAVLWAAENKITSGTDSVHFTPSADCTRAQLWTMLARQAGADLTGGENRYAKARDWAMNSGVSDGTNPDKTISRAEMVTMLYRAAGSPAVSAKSSFTDVAPDAYYADAVAWAAENGITSGIGGGLFAPNSACTRAQIVTFLYRVYQGN